MSGLACENCTALKSREAYIRQQRLFLPDILAGRSRLRLARRKRSARFHIELINEKTHAYCGERIDPPQLREEWNFRTQAREDLCAQCLVVLTDCIEALPDEEVDVLVAGEGV